MLRLLIVAQVRLYREELVSRLSDSSGIEVVGAAGDREEALSLAGKGVDAILVDISTPKSMQIIEGIHGQVPSAHIVALGLDEHEDVIIPFAEAGVDAYLPVDGSLERLVRVLHGVAQGEALVSPRVAGGLFRRISTLASRHGDDDQPSLTPRETQIADLLAQGLTNREISRRLNIQVATVKNHVHSILNKMHLHRRAEVGADMRKRRARRRSTVRRQ